MKIPELVDLFTLITHYIYRVEDVLENKDQLEKLKHYKKTFKKIDKRLIYVRMENPMSYHEYVKIFKYIKFTIICIDIYIEFIKTLNLYEERVNVSETSITVINECRIDVLNLYEEKKHMKYIQRVIEMSASQMSISATTYVYNRYKNYHIMDNIYVNLFIEFYIGHIKLKLTGDEREKCIKDINKFKIECLEKEITFDINKSKNSPNLTTYKFNEYTYDKLYDSIDDAVKSITGITFDDLYKNNICYIHLINKKRDNIYYTIENLFDKRINVSNTQVINDDYITKTTTINNKSSNYISDTHNLKIKFIKKNINVNFKFILIYQLEDKFTILNSKVLTYDEILPFIDYDTYLPENYNQLIEESVLTKIENENLLDKYLKKIKFDYQESIKNINTTVIRNNILNTIKGYNKNNIEELLDLIISEVNFEDKTPELFLSFIININDLRNKLKKDIIDNNFHNLEKIINDNMKSIIKVYEDTYTKYYLMNLD